MAAGDAWQLMEDSSGMGIGGIAVVVGVPVGACFFLSFTCSLEPRHPNNTIRPACASQCFELQVAVCRYAETLTNLSHMHAANSV